MKIEKYDPGVPCWIDVNTPDTAAARAFYGGLFGWEIEEGPAEAGGYCMCMYKGEPVAGIGPQPQPGPPFWTTYIATASADDTVAKVGPAGGTVFVEPFDVMDVGRMAIFADPGGAGIAVWEPRSHKGAGLANEPNTFSWNELMTTDTEGAKPFYNAVFGWGEVTHEGDMPYTEWQVDGRSVAGMMPKPPMVPAEVPNNWSVYFAVEDCDATVAKAQELGGSVVNPPMDIPQGRFAVLSDPQGAVFNVMQLAEGMGG